MQVVTVPKEVIWVTRLLWIDIFIRLIMVSIMVLTSSLGDEEKLVRLLMVLPKTVIWMLVLLGINHFLLKGNKWAMRFLILFIGSVIVSNIFAFFDPLTIENQIMYITRILLGCSIIYLLIKQKAFFK